MKPEETSLARSLDRCSRSGKRQPCERLVTGATEEEVAAYAPMLRSYGYREQGDILRSEVTGEFYQWWIYPQRKAG